jgi:hypothetical protein
VLKELLKVLTDDKERKVDQYGFNTAAAEYREIDAQVRMIEGDGPRRMEDARLLGEQIAAAIGGILVSVVTAFAIFVAFA